MVNADMNNNHEAKMNGHKLNMDGHTTKITLTWENINVIGPDPNTCITRLMRKPKQARKEIIKNGD